MLHTSMSVVYRYGRGHKKVPVASAHYVGSTGNVEKKTVIERFDNVAFTFIDEAFIGMKIKTLPPTFFVSILHSARFDPCKKTVMTNDLQAGLEGSPQQS